MEADDLRDIPPSFDEVGERHIADRLDAIEAERVIARALELEGQSLQPSRTVSPDQLTRIAKEIGLDPIFVRQALSEHRLGNDERSRIDRWILPDQLVESLTFEGFERAELDEAINKWMTINEGLVRAAPRGDVTRWYVDRRLGARVRSGTLTGKNRISRLAGGDIGHQVQTLDDDEHLVSFSSNGERPLVVAKLVIAAAAIITVLGIVAGAAASLSSFLISIPTFLVIGAAIAATGIFGARRWARGIRHSLRVSLSGLSGRLARGVTNWRDRFRRRSSPN